MPILGSTELFDDVHKKDLCVDCGACVGLCPYFVSHNGKIARLFPCTLPQGRCFAHCPKTEVDLNRLSTWMFGSEYDLSALGAVTDIRKAKAGPAMTDRGMFQNGGTVSALLTLGFRSGRITAAALTSRKGLTPEPVLAESEEAVLACSGSKYMASPTLSTVMKESASGSTRRMAVVGTACQMTALAQMRMNPLEREDFRDPVALSIGLFCTWALDTRKLKHLLKDHMDLDSIVSMDVPPPPAQVMTFNTSSGTVDIPLSDIRPLIPKGCGICPDMTAEFADVSVGALEGEPGWNTLIVRTARGAEWVEDAAAQGFLILEAMPEASLANLKTGALGKKKKALLRAKEDNCLNVAPEAGRSALVIDPERVESLLT